MNEDYEVYIDSRGAEMEPMNFSEALEIVHSLAEQNQIDANDIAHGDEGLSGQRTWQGTALDTVHDLVVNHADDLDDLEHPEQAGDWDDGVLHADRALDPADPLAAVKIVLAMGADNALSPEQAGREIELADEIDRQQQALDLVRDLVGLNGAELAKIATIDISPIMDR